MWHLDDPGAAEHGCHGKRVHGAPHPVSLLYVGCRCQLLVSRSLERLNPDQRRRLCPGQGLELAVQLSALILGFCDGFVYELAVQELPLASEDSDVRRSR